MRPARRQALATAAVSLAALALAPAAPAREDLLYVSLGDSYAAASEGFVYQVPGLARKRGYDLRVVNFACGGATSSTLVSRAACTPTGLAPGVGASGQSQLAEATAFIRANRRNVALVSVSIGGNDVTRCLNAADPEPCVAGAMPAMRANVGIAARQLRKAAGKAPVLVGTTYPAIPLGAWATPGTAASRAAAARWPAVFRSSFNPALRAAYAKGRGQFVDVTAQTGAYGPMTAMETLAPYGALPRPVAEVCRISLYCSSGANIHLNRGGYGVIARMVAARLPRR